MFLTKEIYYNASLVQSKMPAILESFYSIEVSCYEGPITNYGWLGHIDDIHLTIADKTEISASILNRSIFWFEQFKLSSS